jgi:hypothetical protein
MLKLGFVLPVLLELIVSWAVLIVMLVLEAAIRMLVLVLAQTAQQDGTLPMVLLRVCPVRVEHSLFLVLLPVFLANQELTLLMQPTLLAYLVPRARLLFVVDKLAVSHVLLVSILLIKGL